jgi:ribose/xylose/arabinose/galactoside ABC-type transport system permease subunit
VVQPSSIRERIVRNLRRNMEFGVVLEKFGILIGFIFLVVVSTIIEPRFLTAVNLLNVIRQVSIFGILAIGQTFIILTAGIDLSVGSVLALAVVLVAGVLPKYGILPAIAVGLAVGAAMGTINGLGVTLGRVQPFVMTLGMLGIARGLAFMYTGGMPIPVLDKAFLFIGNGYLLGVPVPAIIFVVLVILAALMLRYTPFGRYVYAIGSNEEAARLSGVNVLQYKTLVYTIGGLLSGVAGILYASQLAVGPPIAGEGYELDSIAAVVVGGTSLFGGEGGMFGTFLGAAIIGSMANILNLTGVSPFVQKLAKGLLIIAAVIIKARGRKT